MELIAASAIVMVAALLQACTGFGFSVLATPFLLLVFEISDAIQINIALSIMISLVMMPKLLPDIDRALFGRLVIGSLMGAPAGILIYAFADPVQLRMAIGLLLLVLTAFILRDFRIGRSTRRDFITGGFSGALTSGLGMPGPPLMVYFAGSTLTPRALRSTTLACFLVIYSISLVLQVAVGSSSVEIARTVLLLMPATGAGVILGHLLFHRIDTASFMRLLHGILIVTGAYLFIGGLLSL